MTHDCVKHTPSSGCYQRCKCRCADCKRAQSRYAKQRRVRLAQGINDLVDAAPVREHVENLMRMGMSHGTIAVAAGLSNSGLQALLGLKSNAKQLKRMHRRSAAQILAVKYAAVVGSARVDATASRRRLQDLGLRGFAAAEVSAHAGVERQTLVDVRQGKRRTVLRETAEAIARTHQLLEGREPSLTSPTNRKGLVTLARKSRWAPLAAYDDIENRNERPKGVA